MTKKTKPPHEPTEYSHKQVRLLSAIGMRQVDISRVIGISVPTLRQYYSDDLAIGKAEATAKVAKTLFEQATKPQRPNISACIFWLKTQAGWKEPKDETYGVKELTQMNAESVSKGKFSTSAAPRLIVDND